MPFWKPYIGLRHQEVSACKLHSTENVGSSQKVRHQDFNLRKVRAQKLTQLFSQDRTLRGAPDGGHIYIYKYVYIYIHVNIYIYGLSNSLIFLGRDQKNAKNLFTILCTFFRFWGISKVDFRLGALHHLNIPLPITIIFISHYHHEPNDQHPEALV